MNKKQPFNALLEDYVYAVATNFIESASPDNQTQLINLVNSIDTFSAGSSHYATHTTKTKTALEGNSPIKHLEQQWRVALTKPLSLAKEKKALYQRFTDLNQQQISSIILHISTMEMLIDQANQNLRQGHSLNRLVAHYQRIHTNYTARLVQLQTFQDVI